jgi:hypothetical protein
MRSRDVGPGLTEAVMMPTIPPPIPHLWTYPADTLSKSLAPTQRVTRTHPESQTRAPTPPRRELPPSRSDNHAPKRGKAYQMQIFRPSLNPITPPTTPHRTRKPITRTHSPTHPSPNNLRQVLERNTPAWWLLLCMYISSPAALERGIQGAVQLHVCRAPFPFVVLEAWRYIECRCVCSIYLFYRSLPKTWV